MVAPVSCPGCAERIERALLELDGVTEVDVRRESRIVIVRRRTPDGPDDAVLVDRLARVGIMSVVL